MTSLSVADAVADLVSSPYVEPCPDCVAGDHQFCDGRTLDHSKDEFVPCPCRADGHDPKDLP
jgi:hypothetical protein